MKIKKKLKFVFCCVVILLMINMLLPTKIQNPVEGCGKGSYNQKSFWHPWGDHRHAGIDIFAKKGTIVHPAIGGIVVATARNFGEIMGFFQSLRLVKAAEPSAPDHFLRQIFGDKRICL